MVCPNQVLSLDSFHLVSGRQFLCHHHFCHLALPIVSRFPTNQGLSSCCIRIVFELNRDEQSRSEVLQNDGVALVVKVLNLVQVNPKLVEEALLCIRSICSSENESLPEVYSRNVIGCVLMSILSHPTQDEICASWNTINGMDCCFWRSRSCSCVTR